MYQKFLNIGLSKSIVYNSFNFKAAMSDLQDFQVNFC